MKKEAAEPVCLEDWVNVDADEFDKWLQVGYSPTKLQQGSTVVIPVNGPSPPRGDSVLQGVPVENAPVEYQLVEGVATYELSPTSKLSPDWPSAVTPHYLPHCTDSSGSSRPTLYEQRLGSEGDVDEKSRPPNPDPGVRVNPPDLRMGRSMSTEDHGDWRITSTQCQGSMGSMSFELQVSSSIPPESGYHSHQFDKSSTMSLVSTIDSDSADSCGEETIVFDDHLHCDPLFPDDVTVTGPGSTDTALDFGSLVDWDTISTSEVEIVFYSDNDALSEAEPDLASMPKVAPNDGEGVYLVTRNSVVEHHDGDLAHALLLDKPVDYYLGHIPAASHVPYLDVATHIVCKAREFGFKSVRFKSQWIEPAANLASLTPTASSHMVSQLQQALPVPQVSTVGTRRFSFKDLHEERIGSEGDVDDSLSVDIIMRQFTACIQDRVLHLCMGSDSCSHL